jgi:thymidine kinase
MDISEGVKYPSLFVILTGQREKTNEYRKQLAVMKQPYRVIIPMDENSTEDYICFGKVIQTKKLKDLPIPPNVWVIFPSIDTANWENTTSFISDLYRKQGHSVIVDGRYGEKNKCSGPIPHILALGPSGVDSSNIPLDYINNIPQINVIVSGTMFAGKSNKLTQIANTLEENEIPYVKLMPENSRRHHDTENLSLSHDKLISKVTWVKSLKDLPIPEEDIVLLDEPHIFNESDDVTQFVLDLKEKHGKRVIVAGIYSSFHDTCLGPLPHIMALEHTTIEWLKGARCNECRRHNATNSRLRESPRDDQGDILVGGEDIYYVICPECEFNENKFF